MKTIRHIKLMVFAALVTAALAVPAAGSAAGVPAAVVTAAGVKVKPCEGTDTAPLLMFVRGIDCERALALANEASSSDDPCPSRWHTRRRVRLQAVYHGRRTTGPSVFLCTQHAGKRAFTYKPIGG